MVSPFLAGARIAGRYRLQMLLGRGAHGEVWEAEDLVAGDSVAVKLLHGGPDAQAHREIATLRLLRLPFVVRLLDEGSESGWRFLVMERAPGTPFPGEQTGRSPPWEAIAATTEEILRAVTQIHAHGVIHRDLKPANILVDAGRPTILDFGMAHSAFFRATPKPAKVFGTPYYMAPEQLRGEEPTAQTDLYALGVMLYEVLSSELPHAGKDFHAFFVDRLGRRARPLRDVAPSVPVEVAAVIDQLLAMEPEQRPRSAAHALHLLQGKGAFDRDAGTLPWLGSDEPMRRTLHALRLGRAVDLAGGPGSGRSRIVAEIAGVLVREGKRVIRLLPASRPFASLEPLLGSPGVPASCSLRELRLQIDDRLRTMLGEGVVIVADDANCIDRWTSAALARCSGAGCVLRAFPVTRRVRPQRGAREIVHLAPLDEDALMPLFCGPERFFHLRTDAARALWVRTGGVPRAVTEEVNAWVRAGIARWYQDRLLVDREALDRLGAGLRLSAAAPSVGREGAGLEPQLEELLAWLWLAWPNTRAKLIAEGMGEALWFVEACIEDLVERGAARRFPGDGVEPRATPSAAWSPERRSAAHRRLARLLAPGAEGRLLHLVSAREDAVAGEDAEIAIEACALAEQRARQGFIGGAIAALHEGAAALRHTPARLDENAIAAQEALFALWAEIAVIESTPYALDRALYEICRARPRTAALEHIEALVRAAIALSAGSDRALAAAEAVPPFTSPRLERTRQGLRVLAARHAFPERLECMLADIAVWAEDCASRPVRAALAGWTGRLRYQQGRFRESAELHARAAEDEPWAPQRIHAMLMSVSARIEAFHLTEAAEQARKAHAAAVRCRHAHHEARAMWLLRTIAYRRGEALRPDPELGAAAARLGVPDLEALICMCEAAICFHAGEMAAAAELAMRAYRLWTGMGKRWAAPLVRCLAIASGEPGDDEEIQSLAGAARACPVSGLGVQMLGLLGIARPDLAVNWVADALALCAGVPRARWRQRLDVLSVDEALRAVGARSAPGLGAARGPIEPDCAGAGKVRDRRVALRGRSSSRS